jgi:hypothetical protein
MMRWFRSVTSLFPREYTYPHPTQHTGVYTEMIRTFVCRWMLSVCLQVPSPTNVYKLFQLEYRRNKH